MSARIALRALAATAVLGSLVGFALPQESDFEVVRMDPDPPRVGGLTTVHAVIANRGPDRTAAPFTVAVTLPEGYVVEGTHFPDACSTAHDGRRVTCEFPAGLPPLRSATALVSVRARDDVHPVAQAEGYVEVFSSEDHRPDNNCTPFMLKVQTTPST